METYIFVLGRDPELSKLEIKSYFQSRNLPLNILKETDKVLLLETLSINSEKIISELGGTQKIAKVITSFDNLYEGTKNKVRYAVSNYSDNEEEDIKGDLKEYFKKEGIRANIKKSHHEQDFLTPSEAKNVVEVIQFNNINAKVIAVFDPKEHKKRDTQRPVQRPLHTISIRLAKILINLSQAKPGETLLDPFCGIGTILQEAMLMNINGIGFDNDLSCITSSEKNLKWIQGIYNPKASYRLINSDSRQVLKFVSKVDCVATEPYMGPFMKSYPTEGEAKRIMKELVPLYQELVRVLAKVTKHRIVIVTPIFIAKSRERFKLDLEPTLRKLNLKFEEPIPYKSPTSRILRLIWVIHK